MMINDPLSDMIARIKNAATRKRSKVLTPASRLRQRVLDVLLAGNLTLTLLVLFNVLATPAPREFTAFPSLLLFLTSCGTLKLNGSSGRPDINPICLCP